MCLHIPAYRPGQIQVVGDRFPESCQIPYQKCKSHCELGRPRLLTDLPVSIQYWIQNDCSSRFGNRPTATGTVDWVNELRRLIDQSRIDLLPAGASCLRLESVSLFATHSRHRLRWALSDDRRLPDDAAKRIEHRAENEARAWA
jgi:hypothetical protein